MSSMPWVKVYTEFLDDAKFSGASDGVKLRFLCLIMLAGECDQGGALKAGSDWLTLEKISWRLRMSADQLGNEIDALQKLGVIKRSGRGYSVVNFERRQGRAQSEKRANWVERQARRRANMSRVTGANVTRDIGVSHSHVSPSDTDKDIDTDTDKDCCLADADNVQDDKSERAKKIAMFGIENPTLDALADELGGVANSAFFDVWHRLADERIAISEQRPGAKKLDNFAGYAVSQLRQLKGK